MNNSIIEFDVLAENYSLNNNYSKINEILYIESPVDNQLEKVEDKESPNNKRKVTSSFDEDPDYIPNNADESNSDKINEKFIVINKVYNWYLF